VTREEALTLVIGRLYFFGSGSGSGNWWGENEQALLALGFTGDEIDSAITRFFE
jgi:hypothetical protein